MGRAARAAAVGVSAAAAYLAGARLNDARPVKGSGLALLALAALVSAQASVKARSTEQRLNSLLNGEMNLTLTGLTLNGNLEMNNHNINELGELNNTGGDWGSHGPMWMNGFNIHMQGGKINDSGQTWPP